ncbi:MAG TPA: PVC-type heme-binding CxxCH protein [Pirellulales bacterium]|nr:PVC-type heme-binding CxxCH protein [Pirellulales bacterium]
MKRCSRLFVVALFVVPVALAGRYCVAADAARLQLKPHEHVAIIGNTLADRMQHFGYFETLLHHRYPAHELVVRNLGFSGDELTIRLRSAGFGSPDDHLRACKADVVLAFFGYNESYAGPAGLPKFKQDLAEFIKHMLAEKYNGQSAPRLVLLSPIGHENLADPNLPDGSENNVRIAEYTAAMAQVAAEHGVLFVDLYGPTLRLYEQFEEPLTINGVHLNERGDRELAAIIERALFGPAAVPADFTRLEKLRRAVLDKNSTWFAKYRTTDGYSIFGGRADLKFVGGQTNRDVMQRELEILEVMTANRDRRVWAVAGGSDLAVDDSNAPPHVPVETNKPGPLPGGKHVFLSGEAEIEKMTLAKGIKVELFASEEMFPELVNPVQMAFDTQGRLWVSAWGSYPHWKPGDELNDKLLVLEDTNGDGRADRCITFADHLHNPTGFEFWSGGVFVAMAPDLLFLRDLDGDGEADTRERVLSGLDSADTHHTSNSFTFDPGGALYFQEGTFHHSQVETPYGPPVRLANAGVFRYEPRSQKFDVYVSYGFANPHGHAFDYWGQDIVVDGTGANPYHAALFSGHVDFPNKHSAPPQVYKPRTRPCPGIEYLSSQHFPESMRDNLLVANVIGFQGILQYRVSDRGASLAAEEVEPLLSSSDPSFRPADLEVGPDGALYFTDWHNPIIGHMQHNLRDPSRDRTHGRVYRVTYEGHALLKPAKIAAQPIDALLDLLHDPDGRVRYRAKIELSARPTKEVIAALTTWVTRLNKNDPRHEHDLLESLWVYQHHNQVNVPLLERMLASRDFRARAAAARVLCYWRDRIPDALARFKMLAADEHPRVRLEALRGASFFPQPEAVEIVAIAEQQPLDEYLTYVRGETLKALGPTWQKALASASKVRMTTDAGKRYWLRHLASEQLVKQPRTADVSREMLLRAGLLDEVRRQAARRLAELEHKSELQVVLEAVRTLDARDEAAQSSVVFDLVRQLVSADASQLAAARAELEKLAIDSKQPVVRQVGLVSLVGIDGTPDRAWTLAAGSVQGLTDLLAAIPMLADPGARAALYDQVAPLLEGLPQSLASAKPAPLPAARFVRIELPRAGTLTLAEVEVISGGRNVARAGKARQKNTASGGDANRAIDGNASGAFGDGGQTHTEENTARPWWELDLKSPVTIEQVVVHNRTDGYLGRRLDGFTLELLDADRHSVFKREKIEAPRNKFVLATGQADPGVAVRHAAMAALASMRGREAAAFQAIAPFLSSDVDRAAAITALERIPRSEWPKTSAAGLLENLTTWLTRLPAAERTSPAALASLEFADALASLLPPADARRARSQLGELGVRVIRVGTVFERMAYDVDSIAVRAGRPVEFVFENSDLMPHNFVIVAPGSLEQMGMLAERTAQDPGAAERHYVPVAGEVLLGSTLLQPRGVEKLSFTAPKTPGVYPYVCTYPGHWRRMYGALYVVDDLDSYLENPESYLASHPLEIKDDLLKDRRPRTEWTLDSLAGPVSALHEGRSYARGKHLFQVANCVACHKMDGVGNAIGPELTKLDEKMQSLDVLKELLDPSARINEKFQTFAFELNSGKIITGLVLEETADRVRVVEDPLAKKEPIELAKADIAERNASKTSLMPKGLLDKLSREEILDLIAYVIARGNPHAAIVSGNGHEHAGH